MQAANPPKRMARIAGGLYLLSSAMVGVPMLYLPTLLVDANAGATVQNILAHDLRFRLCLVSELAGTLLFLFVVRALYRLLQSIHKPKAIAMVVLVLLAVPIMFANSLNGVAALTLAHGADFLSATDAVQRNALATFFLALHGQGANLANIFWGLWLIPFGALAIKSRIIPRWIGYWVVADGVALVAVSVTTLLAPQFVDIAAKVAILPALGELWMMGWLMIWGVRDAPALSR